nr:toprim domain-containing protein [Rhizobium aethiopicum]
MEAAMMSARDITTALGGFWHGSYGMAKCVAHDDRSPSLSIRDGSDDKVLVKCHAGCDQADVIDALRHRGLWPRRHDNLGSSPTRSPSRRSKPRDDRNEIYRIALVRRLWREATDPQVPPVFAYLDHRGLPPLTDDQIPVFRFHPHCPFGRECVPALIARFSPIENFGPETEPTALFRIRIDRFDGDRRKLALGPSRGQVVKLYQDTGLGGIGIAEGIEKGLALAASGWNPIWVTCGTATMQSFPVLAYMECITIFCDRDESGRDAALAAAARWHNAGREARILQPPAPHKDWDDWYVGGGR